MINVKERSLGGAEGVSRILDGWVVSASDVISHTESLNV